MKCPRCNCDFTMMAKDMTEEMICFSVKYQGDFLDAKTVGGILTRMEILLRESANVPSKVLLKSIEQHHKEVKFWFLVAPIGIELSDS
jgi:hypothetical protein